MFFEESKNGDFRVTILIEIATEMFIGLIKSDITSRSQISLMENLKYKMVLFLERLLEKK